MNAQTENRRSIEDNAIVLRVQKLGDADKIIILLTKNHGILHGVAKGARKTTSKFGGRLEPFMLLNVSLAPGKNLSTLTQVQTLRAYTAPIMASYPAYIVGLALAELTEYIGNFNTVEESTKLFNLLAGALSALSRQVQRPFDILNAYFLRALALAGWTLLLDTCVSCGTNDYLFWFSAEDGLLCENCGRNESHGVNRPVSRRTIEYMKIVFTGQWSALDKFIDSVPAQQALTIISSFATWQLEKPLKSLSLLEREY